MITKTGLAKMLNISRRTVHRYHDLAMYHPHFEADYPTNFEDLPVTKVHLTNYQCWVLYQISQLVRRMNPNDLIAIKNLKLKDNVFIYLSRDHYLESLSEKDCQSFILLLQQQNDYKKDLESTLKQIQQEGPRA